MSTRHGQLRSSIVWLSGASTLPRSMSVLQARRPLNSTCGSTASNTMPSLGRPTSIVASVTHRLLALDVSGAEVVNGHHCHAIGCSKTAQAALFSRLGLATPRGVPIASADEAVTAATGLRVSGVDEAQRWRIRCRNSSPRHGSRPGRSGRTRAPSISASMEPV